MSKNILEVLNVGGVRAKIGAGILHASYKKFSCKSVVPMEGVYSEGLPFLLSKPTRFQQPQMGNPKPETLGSEYSFHPSLPSDVKNR